MSGGLPNPDRPGGEANGERERIGVVDEQTGEESLCADGSGQVSDCLRVLAHRRRRYVLYYLRNNELAEFEDLIDQIALRELGDTAAELDEKIRRAIRIDLYHAQLPKLEDAGIISYDRRSGSLRYHGSRLVERLLDVCVSGEDADPAGA